MDQIIYLPAEISPQNCAYVYDTNTIRVYKTKPTNNTTIEYTDYFINSHYITRTGETTFGNYNTLNYDCLEYTKFSTHVSYRNDFFEILGITFIIVFSLWYISWFLINRIRKGTRL